MGTLRLLERHNLDTALLEEVYRAALRFRAGDDQGGQFPPDREFLDELQAADGDGKRRILAEASGIELQDPADRSLLERLLS